MAESVVYCNFVMNLDEFNSSNETLFTMALSHTPSISIHFTHIISYFA